MLFKICFTSDNMVVLSLPVPYEVVKANYFMTVLSIDGKKYCGLNALQIRNLGPLHTNNFDKLI